MTYREAIRAALRDEMRLDRNLVLLGEDIGIYGGCFKVTEGLKAEFPDQIIDTPVSEEGFAGLAVGAAAMGMNIVIEIMYADFFTLISDAVVNHAAKMHFMSGGDFNCPLTVRLPFGSGTGHGPQHTSSPEAAFMNVPGLKIVSPSTPDAAYFLLREAVRDPNPVLFFEHKMLYGLDESFFKNIGRAETTRESLSDDSADSPTLKIGQEQFANVPTDSPTLKIGQEQFANVPMDSPTNRQSLKIGQEQFTDVSTDSPTLKIGQARLLKQGSDVTIISYSHGIITALNTAKRLEQRGISSAVLDLCTLKPLDEKTILSAVQKTGRAVIIQEAIAFGGVADAVCSLISSDPKTFSSLKGAPLVTGGKNTPIPFNKELEESVIPNEEECAKKIIKTFF